MFDYSPSPVCPRQRYETMSAPRDKQRLYADNHTHYAADLREAGR
jgi:hypothetical protein